MNERVSFIRTNETTDDGLELGRYKMIVKLMANIQVYTRLCLKVLCIGRRGNGLRADSNARRYLKVPYKRVKTSVNMLKIKLDSRIR